ncbi:MAG: hypothetical protein ACP5HG_02080 [Anaerolineae bacterium]
MSKRLSLVVSLFVVLVLLGASIHPASAQSYVFAVPRMELQVYVQPDASARLVYDITFENQGSPIDIVDIGLPHRDYTIDNMTASIDGVTLNDIRTSEYVDIGVEIHLREMAISPGETATLHFEATMPDMVYQDTTNRDFASFRITPTWFDEESVRGASELAIAVHLPEGVEPEEALYQQEPFTDRALFQGHTVVLWEWEDVSLTGPRMVGVSFPQRVMTRVERMTLIELVNRWLADNPGARLILGAINVGLLALLFFRFSGGTGCTVFAILAGGAILLFFAAPILMLPAIPVLIALVIFNEVRLKKKPHDYLPPIAQVEGGGIKRGLTAPEAAILLELPLHKILTLAMFGLLEKGIVTLVKPDPLTVKVNDAFKMWDDPDLRRSKKKRHNARQTAAQQAGTVIHAYEQDFLDQLERNPNKPVEKIDFTAAMEGLITSTAAKMEGFDLAQTREYYERVISRAMEQARQMGEVREREQYLDKYLPWVMMNDNYPTVLTHGGYHYWPMWARPTGGPVTSGAGGGAPTARPSGGGRTSFGDVAASFSGWAETTMGSMAAAVLPGSMNIPGAKGGFVDLSGVDRVTGDVFEAMSKASKSSGGSGGGGRSSCACACAGCACACACAGGGR